MWGRLCCLLAAAATHAEIIDRIAVIVGDSVLTESEIFRQIRLTALQEGQEPDFSSDSRRTAADKLVEQALIRSEIAANRFEEAPATAAERELASLKKQRFPSEAAYQEKLRSLGLTPAEVSSHLRWQITFLNFLENRFRPGVQIPESEIREYYETNLLPKYASTNTQDPPSLEESRAAIERILASARVDQALDRWLGQARTQIRIQYKEEAFR